MFKLKSLFRKGHSTKSSSAIEKKPILNNHHRHAEDKINQYETVLSFSRNTLDNDGPSSSQMTSSQSSLSFDAADKGSPAFHNERGIDVIFNSSPSSCVEIDDSARNEFYSILREKKDLETRCEEYLKTYGELDKLKSEIEQLKEKRRELQQDLLLRFSTITNEKDILISKSIRLPNSAPASIAFSSQNSDSADHIDNAEWDKRSGGSSVSESSVALLQDRILQMEENHYSTSEELQATLQELADLQSQLTELQNVNERLAHEKSVLLESLCRQTEKLEDARTKVDTLRELLLESSNDENTFSEREQKLIELLKDGKEEREVLLQKQKELINELAEAKDVATQSKQEVATAGEKLQVLQSSLDAANVEKKDIDEKYAVMRDDNSCKHIEIKRLTTLLENARCKIEEMETACKNEGVMSAQEEVVHALRKEKDSLETQAASLQDQLSRNVCKITKLKEELVHTKEELLVTANNSKSVIIDLEYKCDKYQEDAKKLNAELQGLREKLREVEGQCQSHMDDKRQLKALLLETQKHLQEMDKVNSQLKDELQNEKAQRKLENEEWNKYQEDLLVTVRVANDIKTEAQIELERLVNDNKQLRDGNRALTAQLENIKRESQSETDKSLTPLLHRSVSSESGMSLLSSVMNHRRNPNISRQDSRLSVKSLIESIENATKQVKTASSPDEMNCQSLSNSDGSDSLSPTSLTDLEFQAESTPCMTDMDETGSVKVKEISSTPPSILTNSSAKMGRVNLRSSPNEFGADRKDPLASLVKNGGSRRNALLKWCQNKTVGYANIEITNFSSSWNDGLALCAILHSYLPDKVPYDELNPTDKKRNFAIAFAAAESVGIKTSLNINDMIQQERPDWSQVMAYVTAIFRHFES